MKQLSWFTPPLEANQGYGLACIETIRGLQGEGVRVQFNNDEPLVHVNFVQPEWYQGNDHQFRIGYTPWESTIIPHMWKEYMSKMDMIWTTSQFCKDVYEAHGVENVHVVSHGINPDVWKIIERTRNDKFVFLHVGGPTARKGGAMVASAFVKVFGNVDDAYLLVKSNGPSEARWVDNGVWRGNIGNHPRVQVVEHDLDESDLVEMYNLAHCMVYPSHGEGFGLIPFQAIATGLPTICTNLTGMADFAEMSMPLEAKWGDGWGIHWGQWAMPDFDNLCELMRDAYDNWDKHKQKAVHSARIIHAKQTWADTARNIISITGDKLDWVAGDLG